MMDNDSQANPAPNADPNRDARIQARRSNQKGGGQSGLKKRVFQSLGIAAFGFVVFILVGGHQSIMGLFGFVADKPGLETSRIDMEVDRIKPERQVLDFSVPAPPEEPQEEPEDDIEKRFEDFRNELKSVLEENYKKAVSISQIKGLLNEHSDKLNSKFENELKRIEAERKEAERRAEAKRREAEKRAKAEAERLKKDQKLDEKQRESSTVVVDHSRAKQGSFTGIPNPSDSKDPNSQFLSANAQSQTERAYSQKIAAPSQTVIQGTIISAVLETAINTELPGNIRAQVIEPVFSFDGKKALMPAGTVVIGQFSNQIATGQNRVLIAWNRAIMPNGSTISLGGTGADLLGRSGTAGHVDKRYGERFGSAILVSAISAIPNLLSGGNARNQSSGTTINIGTNASQGAELGASIGGELANQTKDVLGEQMSLAPIIHIPQGEEVRIFVNRDLMIK